MESNRLHPCASPCSTLKGGTASVHPIQGDELRALRELRRQSTGAFVFSSERSRPMTRFNVSKWLSRPGRERGCPMHTRRHITAN
jgi:type 1 fimbriae regulatory protein FimB/type 1 fimbriae regulatory protein FimE